MLELDFKEPMRCPHCDEVQEGTAEECAIHGWNVGALSYDRCTECDQCYSTRVSDTLVIVEVADDEDCDWNEDDGSDWEC